MNEVATSAPRDTFRRVIAVLCLLGIAVGGGFGLRAEVDAIGDLRRDQAVWDRGVAATDGSVRGERVSRLWSAILAHYELEVTYADRAGARYQGRAGFWTALGSAEVDGATEVRYDPDEPARFAVSWAVAASGARWRGIVVASLVALVALLAGLGGAYLVARAPRRADG